MLRTPGSPWSSRRRPCTLVERPAAVRVVAQPDRPGQLGKADGRRVGLEGWWAGLWHWSSRLQVKWAGQEGSSSASRFFSGAQSREQSTPTRKLPSLSLASPSPAPPPPATAPCRGQARLCAPEPYRASSRLVACPISAAPKDAAPLVAGVRVERDHSVLSRHLRAGVCG